MTELLTHSLDRPALVTNETIDGLDRIGVALADPTRRRILVQLLDGPQCPSDLASAIGTSRSNLSNHLSCLRGCRLISAERAGRNLHYHLVSEQFATALQALLGIAATLPDCSEEHPATMTPTTFEPGNR